MTTATKITLVRVLLIPVFLVCMYLSVTAGWMKYMSLLVFAVASLTDLVDGKIARRYNQVRLGGRSCHIFIIKENRFIIPKQETENLCCFYMVIQHLSRCLNYSCHYMRTDFM